MTQDRLLSLFSEAIATKEGFYLTLRQARQRNLRFPSLAQRNNNPGNLRSWGTRPISEGYASFASIEAGFQALRSQCRKNIFQRKLSFREFFAGQRSASGRLKPGGYPGFAPAKDNNQPEAYASFVLHFIRNREAIGSAWTIDDPIHLLIKETL